MIYLDSVGFKFLISEIKEKIINTRVNKIYCYDKNSFSIFLNKHNLYFEDKEDPIIYLKEEKIENTQFESSFLLQLRKKILSSYVKNAYQFEEDRIFIIQFEKLNVLGNLEKYKLIFELLGKKVNVILLDENDLILTSLYTNFSKDRIIFPNSKYEYPSKIQKYGSLMQKLDDAKRQEFEKSYKPIIYQKKDLTYNEFFENREFETFDSLNSAINSYFNMKNNISSVANRKKPVLKFIKTNIKRLDKILKKIPEDLKQNENYEKINEMANVLTANIHNIKRGQEKVRLFNFYENKEQEYEIDTTVNITKYIQDLFSKYAKAKRKESLLLQRYEDIKKELFYYQEALHFIEKENEISGIEEIEKEFNINYNGKLKATKQIKRDILKYDYEKAVIYVGRNSSENDKITFEIAKPNDTWLHAKDVAGSHVLIKGELSESILLFAAKLASENSKLNGKGPVDYCLKKYVTKQSNYKKGQVIYRQYKTINT